MLRIDQQTITTHPTIERAQAVANARNADEGADGDFVYVVEKNDRGYFVAVNDAADGVRVATL
jgi:hypothetical protein